MGVIDNLQKIFIDSIQYNILKFFLSKIIDIRIVYNWLKVQRFE